MVADWENGQIRVEVSNFPPSANGYEVFLVQVDGPALFAAMFVDGDPNMGIVADPPPFDAVAALISQWRSIGDITVDGSGNGTLAYEKGDNIAETGLNVMMIFGKVTPGQHDGPEDFSKLMVECNGPLHRRLGIPFTASELKWHGPSASHGQAVRAGGVASRSRSNEDHATCHEAHGDNEAGQGGR